MRAGTSLDSARRFFALGAEPRKILIDAQTYDAIYRIAEAREIAMPAVLEEMLEDWIPTPADLARARRHDPGRAAR